MEEAILRAFAKHQAAVENFDAIWKLFMALPIGELEAAVIVLQKLAHLQVEVNMTQVEVIAIVKAHKSALVN